MNALKKFQMLEKILKKKKKSKVMKLRGKKGILRIYLIYTKINYY